MGWPDLSDLVNVACRDTFGVPVTYSRAGLEPLSIVAEFFEPGARVPLQNGAELEVAQPSLGIRVADLVGYGRPQQGDEWELGDGRRFLDAGLVLEDDGWALRAGELPA